MERTATLKLPKDLFNLLKSLTEDKPVEESVKQEMVLALVRKHKISASRGAELLGMHYQDFLDLMVENEVPFFDYEPGEVKKDVETLKKLRKG